MTFVCPTRGKQLVLQTMGHAFAGGVFFCLPYPEEADAGASDLLGVNAALVSAAPGVLSKEILEAELPHLFEGEWDWQVSAISVDQFSVVFPDKAMLRMATRSGKLYFSLHDIMADIKESRPEEPKAEIMPDTRVKLWGVPPKHRRVDRLMAATVMIGRPMEVDQASLPGRGPVRMRFACRSPAKLKGYVQVWFNSEGFTFRLEAETGGNQGDAPLPTLLQPWTRGRMTRTRTRTRTQVWVTTPSTPRPGISWASRTRLPTPRHRIRGPQRI